MVISPDSRCENQELKLCRKSQAQNCEKRRCKDFGQLHRAYWGTLPIICRVFCAMFRFPIDIFWHNFVVQTCYPNKVCGQVMFLASQRRCNCRKFAAFSNCKVQHGKLRGSNRHRRNRRNNAAILGCGIKIAAFPRFQHCSVFGTLRIPGRCFYWNFALDSPHSRRDSNN